MPDQGRNSHIDNIKAVLIFLVVFGHLIEPHLAGSPFLKSIWVFIYFFHMPMFAMLSGMFSKPVMHEAAGAKLVRNVVVPLIAFEFLYEAESLVSTGAISTYSGAFAPYWMLWYLLSLSCWRLMLPLFSRFRWPLLCAVTISIVGSLSESTGYFLGISRTLTFFPFFVLGWKLGPNFLATAVAHVDWGRRLRIACMAIVATALVAVFEVDAVRHISPNWLYGSYSIPRLNVAVSSGILSQLGLYLWSTIIGLAFISLIPRHKMGLSTIGKNSIYVLVWHGFPLILLSHTGVRTMIFGLNDGFAVAISICCSLLIVAVFGHRWSASATDRFIFNPLFKLLMAKSLHASTGNSLKMATHSGGSYNSGQSGKG